MFEMELVYVDAGDTYRGVINALERLSHKVLAQPAEEWLERSITPDARKVPAFFFNSDENLQKRVLSQILSYNLIPPLVIFTTNSRTRDLEVVKFSTEVVTWPCPDDELRLRIERVACVSAYWRNASNLDSVPKALVDRFAKFNLIGESPCFLHELEKIKRISCCEAPVIIEGETGTGKELAARAIHYLSPRNGEPFIPMNCGAIQDSLMESELFGYQRGAFTGATDNRVGLVGLADGGTLFLDEVEALSPKGQISLLRFLQDRCYRAVGGSRLQNADVRVIAASNLPLTKLIETNEFRKDLYYRVAVMKIKMPALRDRKEDIPLLFNHFMHRYCAQYKQPFPVLRPDTLAWLQLQHWSGNVRELENFVHRACFLRDIPFFSSPQRNEFTEHNEAARAEDINSFFEEKAKVIKNFERSYLIRVMELSAGNVTLAAKKACKERRTFGKLLKKHNLHRSSFST